MGWRSVAWVDGILDRYWSELNNEHDEVRAYIADALEFSGKVTVKPVLIITLPSLNTLTVAT